MTPEEHYNLAEILLDEALEPIPLENRQKLFRAAQIHATLSLFTKYTPNTK